MQDVRVGIDIHGLELLRHAGKFGAFRETITLGRQKISIPASKLEALLGADVPSASPYAEWLLRDHFGASRVESLDCSDYEQATIVHDLNLAVPSEIGAFDTVIEFGTIEHVFDIAQALANVRHLCKPGGQILHVSPSDNFCGHGFWQISPEVFFSLYSGTNGFANTEVFLASRHRPNAWYRVSPPRPGRRIPLRSRRKTMVICRTVLERKVAALSVQQSDYVSEWSERGHSDDWFYRRVQYKYFRGVSALNPHLTKVPIAR